jgi:agmatinase
MEPEEEMDEKFAAYLARAFREDDPVLQPRYAEIATFMRTPYRPDLQDVEIGLIGVPFDLGVTNRSGARHGPREVRNRSSSMGLQHHHSKIIPCDLCRVADLGDVRMGDRYSLDRGIEWIGAFYQKIAEAGIVPLSVGGDHSITYPILKAIGAQQPLGLVHVDAHCDTMADLDGSKFHHGGPFRNAVEAGVLDPTRTVQIGIRGNSEPFWDFSYQSGMRVIHIEEFHEMGTAAVVDEARRIVGDGPTYLSFDVDGLDPSFAPGTGTPEVGGLTTIEGQAIVRGMQGLHLVGGDVVEVAPPFDPTGNTALVGAAMMFEILCVLADSVAARRPV